jgi:hypothetical protein
MCVMVTLSVVLTFMLRPPTRGEFEGLRVFVVNRPRFGGKVFQLYKGQLRGSAGHVPAEMTQDEQDTRPRAFLCNCKYQAA